MDIRKVKKLIELLEESGVAEIEIKEGEESVRISRHGPGAVTTYVQAAPAAAPAPAPAPPAATARPAAEEPEPGPRADTAVTAPMVGTFYGSPAPGAKAFVEVGSVVRAGQTLCIIEAMKLMNEIEAECAGTVTEVFAQNGKSVEYGQKLFRIKKA